MAEQAERIQERATALRRAIEGTGAGQYRPISDRILVKRLDEDTMQERESGIVVVQDESEAKTGRAFVVAVGPGQIKNGRRVAPDVEPGDVVVTGKYLGHNIEIDGVKYALVKAGDILAIID